jgi:hypothetical protein
MAQYELTRSPDFVRLRSGNENGIGDMMIPSDPMNADWKRYQQWLASGGVPDPWPFSEQKPTPDGVP